VRIKFWAKTFIAKTLTTATEDELIWCSKVLHLVPDAPESETYLIPFMTLLPSLSFLFASYTTDHRLFSSDIHASARITTVLDLPDHLEDKYMIERQCGQTFQVRGALMDRIGKKGEHVMSKRAVPVGSHSFERTGKSIHVAIASSAPNPFFEVCGIHCAPNIRLEVDLSLNFEDPKQIAVSLKGRVTRFPDCEAYLTIDDNEPVCLFQYHPVPGTTPFHLFYGWQKIQAEKVLSTQPTTKAAPLAEVVSLRSVAKSKAGPSQSERRVAISRL